jgi:hypothetical protein
VKLSERKVAKDEAQIVSKPLLEVLHHRIGGTAVGALVVAVLDERDRCIRRALRMIGIGDRNA